MFVCPEPLRHWPRIEYFRGQWLPGSDPSNVVWLRSGRHAQQRLCVVPVHSVEAGLILLSPSFLLCLHALMPSALSNKCENIGHGLQHLHELRYCDADNYQQNSNDNQKFQKAETPLPIHFAPTNASNIAATKCFFSLRSRYRSACCGESGLPASRSRSRSSAEQIGGMLSARISSAIAKVPLSFWSGIR